MVNHYVLAVSITRSSSCASTTRMSVCSSFSTIICSFSSRKSTRRRAFSGSSLTSAWTFKPASISSKRQRTPIVFIMHCYKLTTFVAKRRNRGIIRPVGSPYSRGILNAQRCKHIRSACAPDTRPCWKWAREVVAPLPVAGGP